MRGLYKIVRNIISPEEAHDISECIKKSPKNDGDAQVPNSFSYYNLPVCNILLGQLVNKVSELAGKKLKPTYSYCRVCFKGADLKPHKDRPSCEYSVTLNISQTHPWIIFMGKRGVTQKPGDGVLYKGCEIEHYRPEFTGDEYVQVFLHYVDADGPHKDYVYDSASELKNSTQYRFVFYPNMFENLSNYYTVQNALSKEELKQIQTVLATKILVDAQVGSQNSGSVEPSIRRSKVFWLPKTDEFAQLYTLFHKVIGQCNDTYYRFKLTEITEHIQYTVYSSEDEGFYDWHMDMGPGKSNRKLSLVCQLTDPTEYEGGELRIHTGHGHVTAEKEQGIIILFPSYLLHCVTPVTKGTRRSLVLWIEGPSFV